jgi:hypothetical protein
MKQKTFFLFGLLSAAFVNAATITLFIEPYKEIKTVVEDATKKFFNKPGSKFPKRQLKRMVPILKHTSFFASYAGYCTYSNEMGEITFPRKHPQDSVTLIITPKITPVILIGKTVNRFIIPESAPTALFEFTRKKDGDTAYWEIAQKALPSSRIISPFALTLFGTPDQFEVSLESTVTLPGPDLVLPSIKATKHATDTPALLFLKVSKYCAPVRESLHLRRTDTRYGVLIT